VQVSPRLHKPLWSGSCGRRPSLWRSAADDYGVGGVQTAAEGAQPGPTSHEALSDARDASTYPFRVIGWSDFSTAPSGPLVHAVNPDKVEMAMCGYPLCEHHSSHEPWNPMRSDSCWVCARAVNQIIDEVRPPTRRGRSGRRWPRVWTRSTPTFGGSGVGGRVAPRRKGGKRPGAKAGTIVMSPVRAAGRDGTGQFTPVSRRAPDLPRPAGHRSTSPHASAGSMTSPAPTATARRAAVPGRHGGHCRLSAWREVEPGDTADAVAGPTTGLGVPQERREPDPRRRRAGVTP
jgi:hypothetical protein